MAQRAPSAVPPGLAADVGTFARTLVIAVRARQMYSGTHPVAVAAAERCRPTVGPLLAVPGLVLGVTPTTLRVNNEPLPPDIRVREAAALLNGQDIVALRFAAMPTAVQLADFLMLLTFDGEAVRTGGGPARIWENFGHGWLRVDQIEYDVLLAPVQAPLPGRAAAPADAPAPPHAVARDGVWDSLVRSVVSAREMDVSSEQRLLEVARSAPAIRALAEDVALTFDGEGGESGRAATVLMTLQRLVSFVEQEAPDGAAPTIERVAEAAAQLEPALLMRTVAEAAESGVGTPIVKALGERFSDDQVATLVAAAMAAEGKATGRMASALSTLAPDGERQERVLRLARRHVEAAGGPDSDAAWATLEKFLEGPEDAAYVSRLYGEALGRAEARSHGLRLDAPPRIGEWLATVSADSVRTLSTTVLLDLFGLEAEPTALVDTARDLAALADDLLLAGDTGEAARVVAALADAQAERDPDRAAAGRAGIDDLVQSPSLRELAGMAGDLDDEAFGQFERLCVALGPRVLDPLVSVLVELPEGRTRDRVAHAVASFRDDAVASLARSLASADIEHGRLVIHLMRELGTAQAVATLEAITRDGRPEHVRAAINELATMDDDHATSVLGHLLRSERDAVRHLTIDALAAARPRLAGALLASLLDDAQVVGRDFDVAKRALTALRLVGDAGAVPAVARVLRLRSWRAWRRAARLRRLAASVLVSLSAPEAADAIEAARHAGGRARRAVRIAELERGC